MDQQFKKSLWKQYGASIDMLENAISMCPDELWDTDNNFWYWAYHTLFWLDYYLTLEPDKFSPLPPFTLSEFDSNGALPDRTYTKEELLTYLDASRKKCHNLFTNMTDEIAKSGWANKSKKYSVFEISLYNMRHVQHHAAQLNLLLRQNINDAPLWVGQAKGSVL